MADPQKWEEVYPQGTPEGEEEKRFFIALSRDPNWEWKSIAAIAKESRLSMERVEQLLSKYYSTGIVVQNPKNHDTWAYWQRVKEVMPKKPKSIFEVDQEIRFKNGRN